MKSRLILLSIILIAAVLRIVNLSSIPVGFNDDEAAFGYNAYTILETGRDEWGKILPFPVFESFGDWKLVGYLYPTVASVALFGVNEFATRLPSVVFGVLAVFATYLLAKKLFNKETGSIAAFLLAISPWHIIASRNAFESDVLVFFITIATYFFLQGLQKSRYLLASYLCFIACFYIYRSSWIFVPLFVLSLIYFQKELFIKAVSKQFKHIIVLSFLILPLVPVVLTFKGQSRFIQESFISGNTRIGITNDINEKRGICQTKLPAVVCKLAHNKYNQFAATYVNNYLGNLSGATFFDKANSTGFQSFATRGVLYLFELPLLFAGLIFLFKRNKLAAKVLIPWVLLVPLGASATGIGNFGRINIFMPALQIIEAFGLFYAFSLIKSLKFKVITLTACLVILTVSFLKFTSELFLVEPVVTSRGERYGYKQLFSYLASQENNYDQILISKNIDSGHQYIHYAFFQKIRPDDFLKSYRPIKENGWVDFESLGKYKFVYGVPPYEKIQPKTLAVVGDIEVDYPNPKFAINDLRGDLLFKVYDMDQVIKDKLLLNGSK